MRTDFDEFATIITSSTEGDGRLCFRRRRYVGRYIYIMFVSNFLAPIQVRLSPNFVSHTLGHRGRGDSILEGQGQKSRSVGRYALY